MSDHGDDSSLRDRDREVVRQMIELLQVGLAEALDDLEHIQSLKRRLNESHNLLVRATDVLNASPGKAQLPPGLSPEVIRTKLEAKRRGSLPPDWLKRRKPKTAADKEHIRAAKSGVGDFKLESNVDGSATATIDGVEVELSITLAKLLALLADPEIGLSSDAAAPTNENLVPFKHTSDLSDHLQKSLNRRFTAGTLRNLVHRLRRDFEAGGINKYLIQTAGGQVRLARRWQYPAYSGGAKP